MTQTGAQRRFIYGSQYMSDNINYNIDDVVHYGANDETYCNHDCFNCTSDCPYKEY